MMALCNDEVFLTVIVIVEKSHAPTGVRKAHPCEARRITFVGKRAASVVTVQRIHLIGQVSYDQIRKSVVVVIREFYSHSCIGAAFSINCYPRWQFNLLKGSITSILVQEL